MAAAKKEKTEKYVVVKAHTLGHKIGDVIPLTEAKALALVGKVRLQSGGVENVTTSGASQKLKDANAKLTLRVEELKEAAEKDAETISGLEEAAVNGKAKIAELEAEIAKGSDK